MLSKSPIIPTIESLQTILNSIPSPVFLLDQDHRLVMVNDAFCDFARVERDDILNTTGSNPDEQRDVFWRIDEEVFRTGSMIENEEVADDADGTPHIVVTRKRLVHLPTVDGETPFILASISDVTRIREAEARARYLASHDELTGLANRAELNERLADAIELARRSESKVGFLLLDLDGFKAVNDKHGHAAGDELLKVVAKRLKSHVRVVDTVARLGGDEFCIVQVGIHQPSGAFVLAERLVAALEKPVTMGGEEFIVSASIGIALFPDDAKDNDELYKEADQALYKIKRAGGSGFYRTTDGDHVDTPPWRMEDDLRQALAKNQLSLVYSSLTGADGEVHGYEALPVWQHPERGEIPREMFLPTAEKAGLIHKISTWVLMEACKAAATWNEALRVSVNISPIQLEYGDLQETVERALDISGLAGNRLELEMPETALLGDEERVAVTLGAIKARGVHLALDKFGSGSSTIAHLHKFQFDRLKIDESFIANLRTDPRSLALVQAIIHLGQEMNIAVTAEGVDDSNQLCVLKKMGFSEIQGRALGEPQRR
ncbi:putative bifunctional diguanylate cyclase/phosphodiesterase [Amorphus sp. 3PC139-8]|uniref:putative bifunctional diguanylate cyclase/phosphodiesterase n=1 Tax=Amorphus sp. 3PC139-8 TaxID=2735676 RepID=UPI00345DFFE3